MKDLQPQFKAKAGGKFPIILSILMIIVGIILIIYGAFNLYSRYRQVNPVQKMTLQEIILACEKLSAIATNDKWSYEQCKKNLIENQSEAKILTI